MRLLLILLLANLALFSQDTGHHIDGTVVDSVTALPLSGVRVTVEVSGKPVYQATTNSQGTFEINSAKPGTYTASFSKPEYLSSTLEERLTFEIQSDSIQLRGRLIPRSRVAGRVLDAAGRPVSGAELLLDGSLTGQTTTSDAEGNFLFRAAPGTYVLSARPPNTLSPPAAIEDERIGWAHTYYPGVLDRLSAVKISVRTGLDLWGQDIALRVAHLSRVRGIIFDDKGDPTSGVDMEAVRIDETLSDEIDTVSGEDGSFEFPSLPEGEWHVLAETQTNSPKLRASYVVKLGGHDLDRLDLHLTQPFTITGAVALTQTSLAKMVAIFLQPLVAGSEGLIQTTTDSNGNFKIDNVYPGRYKIVAVSPGPPYFLNSVRIGNRELLGQYVDLLSGTLPVDIKFESEGGGVRGIVQGCDTGTVALVPQDRTFQQPQFVQTTRCGEQGRFQITNVRPGDYYAFAFDQWQVSELLSGLDQSLFNKAVRVHVDRGTFVNVDLRITSRIQ